MGTYNTKSPQVANLNVPMARRAIANTVLLAALAVTLGVFWMQSAVHAQYGALLPQFSNTAAEAAGSVRVIPSQRNSSGGQRHQKTLRRPQSPRLGMTPRSFLRPARFRRQDGEGLGEGQGAGVNPFGDVPVESPIQESPFAPSNPNLPDSGAPIENPFGEPEIRTPVVDPTPRTPPMDTQPRPPRLPQGAEFTPEEGTIPDLPTPFGDTRETDKARTEPKRQGTGRARIQRSTPEPGEADEEAFDEDSILLEDDPQPRPTPRNTKRRRRTERDDDPRRPFRSNVYRPARDPSYYVKPLEQGQPGYNAAGPNGPQGANPYAANPNAANPYAANPYAANPYPANAYAANPYAVPYQPPYGAPYQAPYAGAYAINPYAGLGCHPACMGCQSCAPANCCPPTNAYADCPTPTPADYHDDVYDPVVGESVQHARSGLGLKLGRRRSNGILTQRGVPLYYLSLFGGWSDLSDLEINNEEGTINLDSRDGVGLGAAFGQIQGRNLRSEFELTYRNHDIEDLFLNDLAGGSETLEGVGDVESFAGMFNLYWEFVDLLGGRLSPYIGAGLGAVNVTADARLDGGTEAFQDGEDSSFAYQYMVGLNYKLREHSDLFVEYRHFAADSLRLDASLPEGSLLNGEGELNYRTNNIFFGMRLKF